MFINVSKQQSDSTNFKIRALKLSEFNVFFPNLAIQLNWTNIIIEPMTKLPRFIPKLQWTIRIIGFRSFHSIQFNQNEYTRFTEIMFSVWIYYFLLQMLIHFNWNRLHFRLHWLSFIYLLKSTQNEHEIELAIS